MDIIATILVNYNSAKDTKACVESLLSARTTGFRHNIVVVDNGSSQPLQISKNILSQSQVSLVRSEINLGFTGGNNLGITFARDTFQPDYFFLLNNDTTVAGDCLVKLYRRADQTDELGVVSPKIYFTKGREFHDYPPKVKGKVLWYAGGSIDWPNLTAFHRGVDEVDHGQFDAQTESDFATGCAVLIPRQIIETVGLLDKKYFLYFEDVELSYRWRQHNFKLYFEPAAKVWHHNATSGGGAGNTTSVYYQTRNRLLFFSSHGSWRTRLSAIAFAWRTWLRGKRLERRAVRDWLLHRWGKQVLA